MNAKQAKKLTEEANAKEAVRLKTVNDKLKVDQEAARLRAKKNAKNVLKKIHDKIKAAIGVERKVDQWVEYDDARVGYAYLRALVEELQKKLEKEKYKFSVHYYDSYARMFDGSLMNPEVIGYEYSKDSAIIYVEW